MSSTSAAASTPPPVAAPPPTMTASMKTRSSTTAATTALGMASPTGSATASETSDYQRSTPSPRDDPNALLGKHSNHGAKRMWYVGVGKDTFERIFGKILQY